MVLQVLLKINFYFIFYFRFCFDFVFLKEIMKEFVFSIVIHYFRFETNVRSHNFLTKKQIKVFLKTRKKKKKCFEIPSNNFLQKTSNRSVSSVAKTSLQCILGREIPSAHNSPNYSTLPLSAFHELATWSL
jgi:hypothetical protein